MHKHSKEKRGDSLIEVMFSVGVFGLVAVGSVGIMNSGLYTAQNSLEITMARNEIDAQAEALRFIHAAYTAEKNASIPESNNYTAVWKTITQSKGNAPLASDSTFLTSYSGVQNSCSSIYDTAKLSSYAINYRKLKDTSDASFHANDIVTTDFGLTSTHPRLIFNDDSDVLSNDSTSSTIKDQGVQGIWVTTVKSKNESDIKKIEYFDFYIRTCWDRLGGGTPNTISTVIRLYNPDYTPNSL